MLGTAHPRELEIELSVPTQMRNFATQLADAVSTHSRARKWQQFMEWAHPSDEDTVLDVGVNTTEYSETDNHLERHYPYPHRVTALGVGADFESFRKRYPLVKTVVGDGTKLPFPDDEFSIAYSNAVVEHVGNHAKQLEFIREMYRVARRGFLTTPNRMFPIELHTRVPLLHLFLPKNAFDRVLRKIGKGWAAGDYMNLLSHSDLASLLREAGIREVKIVKNRFAGVPMTFTAMWTKPER
jgi:ubiquinone/menaquinone biosynthesis C-methylase UbiE